MARSRLVKIGACKNEVLAMYGSSMAQASLKHGASITLLFVMLPTLADREGRLEDRPLRIKAEIFPYASDAEVEIDAMLQFLADCPERFIIRYEIDGKRYIQITKFNEHQSPHHKETESIIPACSKQEPSKSQARAVHEPCTIQVTSNKYQVTSNKKGDARGGKFKPPTLPDVYSYCQERENGIDAEQFCDFYESKGWKVGNQPMKDWKAAVRTWEKNKSPSSPADPRGNLALRDKLLAEMESP